MTVRQVSNGRVRRLWAFQMVSASQAAICQLTAGERTREACRRFLKAVPRPSTRFEELLLLGSVMEIALGGLGRSDEERRQRFELAVKALLSGPEPRMSRRHAIAEWAAARIQSNLAAPLDVASLAAEMDCHETTLRRAFREAWGISMREFRIRACTRGAVELVAGGTANVLAIARLLGYKDDRSLYRVIRKVLGVTPARLMDVPADVRRRACQLTRSRTPPNRRGG